MNAYLKIKMAITVTSAADCFFPPTLLEDQLICEIRSESNDYKIIGLWLIDFQFQSGKRQRYNTAYFREANTSQEHFSSASERSTRWNSHWPELLGPAESQKLWKWLPHCFCILWDFISSATIQHIPIVTAHRSNIFTFAVYLCAG